MKYRITHTTEYTYEGTVPIGYNRVYLTPRDCPGQTCLRSQLEVEPVPAVFGQRSRDYYGNEVVLFTVQEQHDVLQITARSEVQLTPLAPPEASGTAPWEEVVLLARAGADPGTQVAHQFIYPAETVTVSAALRDYAAESFAPGTPILLGAIDLMARIHREFAYDPEATTVTTPVEEILEKRRGACQDFAHLQIGCLRALGLPARYVSGYVAPKQEASGEAYVGAQASHAWVAVFLPGHGWIDLDPTNNCLPADEHITIAWGRNYDEVSPVRGVILGGGAQNLAVEVDVSRMAE